MPIPPKLEFSVIFEAVFYATCTHPGDVLYSPPSVISVQLIKKSLLTDVYFS